MLLVSGGILLSRIFGLTRDIVFADYWGTGVAFAAFTLAFTVPNLLRALFGEGAFSAAFVPAFSDRLEKQDLKAAWDLACNVVSMLALVLAAAVLLISGLGLVAAGLAPADLPARFHLALRLLPIVMPYALLICLTGAFGGVLNSLGRFAVPALSPVILNLVFIATVLGLCPQWQSAGLPPVYAIALAVLLAGFLQLGLQLAACARRGLRFQPRIRHRDPDVRHVAMLMAPALVGIGVTQMNVFVDRILAGWLGSAAIGSLYYSQRLVYLPVGLFGVAMSVVCLPALSRAWSRGDREAMRASMTYAFRQVLFLALPATALLAALRIPVIRLLFERGAFDSRSTTETAWALAFYLPGIPAFCCAKVAVTPFYARHDTRTPVRIALVCMVVNLILNLILMQFLRQGGLALATAVSSWLNVFLLLRLIRRQDCSPDPRVLFRAVCRLGFGALLAAFAARLAFGLPLPGTGLQNAAHLGQLFHLALGGAAGATVYLGVCILLGSREPRELIDALRRRQ